MNARLDKIKLQEIAKFILEGMSKKEACILAEVDYDELKNAMHKNEAVNSYIEKQIVMFKYNHVREMQGKKSDKTSQWLLEKLRPDEFGAKAKTNEQPTINIINAIMKDIQNANDPIVATVTRSNRAEESIEGGDSSRQRIAEALG